MYLDGAAVGIGPILEQLREELLVEVVDGVVEGQEDELRRLFFPKSAGNLGTSAEAVRQTAHGRVAVLGGLLGHHRRHGCHQGQQGQQSIGPAHLKEMMETVGYVGLLDLEVGGSNQAQFARKLTSLIFWLDN